MEEAVSASITEEGETRAFSAHRMAQERGETDGRGAESGRGDLGLQRRAGRAPGRRRLALDGGAAGSGGKAGCLLSQRVGRP